MYVSKRNPRAAAELIDTVEAACMLLATHPGVGRVRDEIAPGILSWPVGSYVIFYRSDPQPVVIARVLHGSRDLPVAFEHD